MWGGHILVTVTHIRKQSNDTEANWEDIRVSKFSHTVYCNKTDVEQMSDFIPCVWKTLDMVFEFRVCYLPGTPIHGGTFNLILQ